MTIKTRRIPFLPWEIPGNSREMKPGETVVVSKNPFEGAYIWVFSVIDADTANVEFKLPYTLRDNGDIILDPQTTSTRVEREFINHWGPNNRNWKWIGGKEIR